MYQSDRGNYKTKESLTHSFTHSCLGRIIILLVIIFVLWLLALISVPGEESMKAEMMDNIQQCIEDNDSIKADGVDDVVNNFTYIFTSADGPSDSESMQAFNKYNRLEYYGHSCYATTYVHNNIHPEGVRVGFGIFGIVIPTVSYKDLLLTVGPMHKGYNKPIAPTIRNDEYFGENPGIREFHYKGDPEN